jgi:hypothetical protein
VSELIRLRQLASEALDAWEIDLTNHRDSEEIAADRHRLNEIRDEIIQLASRTPVRRPVPFPRVVFSLVWRELKCGCGRRFWTIRGYRQHYVFLHLLKLNPYDWDLDDKMPNITVRGSSAWVE